MAKMESRASLTQARWRAALRAELATGAGTKPRDGFCLCEQEIREGGKSTTLQGGRTDDEWRRETGGGETLKKRTGGGVGGESSWIERSVANGDRSKTEWQTLPETRTGEVRGFGRGQDRALLGPTNQ